MCVCVCVCVCVGGWVGDGEMPVTEVPKWLSSLFLIHISMISIIIRIIIIIVIFVIISRASEISVTVVSDPLINLLLLLAQERYL